MAGTFWVMSVVDSDVVEHAMIHDENILEDSIVLEETAVMSSEDLQICKSLADRITEMLHVKGHLPQNKKIEIVESH